MGGGGKIRLLTLALTGLLVSCTSNNKSPEPAPAIYTLTIEVYDAPAGSTTYTKTCSNYQPGQNGATGTCLTP